MKLNLCNTVKYIYLSINMMDLEVMNVLFFYHRQTRPTVVNSLNRKKTVSISCGGGTHCHFIKGVILYYFIYLTYNTIFSIQQTGQKCNGLCFRAAQCSHLDPEVLVSLVTTHLEMNIIRGWLLNCGDLKCHRSHVGGKDCS